MALQVPSYPNPYDPTNPLENAYAWISGLMLDASTPQGQGRITVNIHPSETAWQALPLAQVAIGLGQVMTASNPAASPPVALTHFPTLAELMADPDFAAAYAAIGKALYTYLIARVPAFAGSKPV